MQSSPSVESVNCEGALVKLLWYSVYNRKVVILWKKRWWWMGSSIKQ